MKIIVINGQGGSGKDTFVGYCGYEDDGIFNFSMVDKIKIAAEDLGWTGTKTPKDRKFLSDLKDLAADYNDCPFRSTLNKIQEAVKRYKVYHSNGDKNVIVFVHSREPKDIQRWVKDYGAKTLLILRSDIENEFGNHADDEVFDFNYDYMVDNDKDLNYFRWCAKEFIDMIKNEEWESDIWKK